MMGGEKTFLEEKGVESDAARRVERGVGPLTPRSLSGLTGNNQALQRLLRGAVPGEADEGGMCMPETPQPADCLPEAPVVVRFSKSEPWLFSVEGNPTRAAIAREIYGSEIPELIGWHEATLVGRRLPALDRYVAFPQFLTARYRGEFHTQMRAVLAEDVDRVEGILFETRIDADDEAALIGHTQWWAARRDLQTETGETYFDAYLTRLREDKWYRDYGIFEGKRKPFLDLLYEEVEERAGELNALIVQNSEKYGAYQPALTGGDGEFVKRTADLVLAAAEGYTGGAHSRIIRDALTGLPGPAQAAVLAEVMRRYDETEYLVFRRYGEQSEAGMLFYLLEDLDDDDKQAVTKSLKANAVLAAKDVDRLVEGRGLVGEFMPWTSHNVGRFIEWSTGKMEERQDYWAKRYEEHSGLEAGWDFFWGSVSSLWTRKTWDKTAMIVTLGRLGPGVFARLPLWLQRGMLVAGTGITAYQATISIQELATGRDAYTDETLSDAEIVGRALKVFSDLLMLGAGFAGALQATRAAGATGGATGIARIGVGTGAGGGAKMDIRILRADPKSGEYVAIARDPVSGEYAVISLNASTGSGLARNLSTGRTTPIVNGQLAGGPAGVLPGTAAPAGMGLATGAVAPPGAGLPPAAQGALLAPGVTAVRAALPAGTSMPTWEAAGARLVEIIRTGGPIAQKTRGYGAAIVDAPGYTGPRELRAISGAATDPLGVGAPIVHAPSPADRTLPTARSWTGAPGGGIQHINDAEVELLEYIRRFLPRDARGTIHILSRRGTNGAITEEGFPACPSCMNAIASFAGDYPGIQVVSHAATPSGPRAGAMRVLAPGGQ